MKFGKGYEEATSKSFTSKIVLLVSLNQVFSIISNCITITAVATLMAEFR